MKSIIDSRSDLTGENNLFLRPPRIINLSLEDLIALKLELSAKMINNRLFGLDIWRNSGYIIKEALLMFAISTTQSKKDAARFLGLTYLDFKKALKKFEVDNYFLNKD